MLKWVLVLFSTLLGGERKRATDERRQESGTNPKKTKERSSDSQNLKIGTTS